MEQKPKENRAVCSSAPATGYATGFELETRPDADCAWGPVYRSHHATVEGARKNVRDLREIARFDWEIRIIRRTGEGVQVIESHNDEAERTAIAVTARRPEV